MTSKGGLTGPSPDPSPSFGVTRTGVLLGLSVLSGLADGLRGAISRSPRRLRAQNLRLGCWHCVCLASTALGPCAGRTEAQGDSRSGGQSCVDWLAACQALDPPPNPVPSALPVIGHCRLLLAAKEAGHSFRKGQLSPGPGHEGGGGRAASKCLLPWQPWPLGTLGRTALGSSGWRVRRQRYPWLVSVPETGHLSARTRGEAAVPPCPVLSHRHPPGSLPRLPALPPSQPPSEKSMTH